MGVSSSSSLGRRIAGAIAILVVGALPLGSVVMVIFPVSKQLAAPILCPTGTARSFVVSYTEHPEPGTTNFKSDPLCESADGKLDRTGTFITWLVLTGYAAAAIGLNMARSAAVARRRSSSALPEAGTPGGGAK